MPKPLKYNKVKVIKITETQLKTLQKMKSYNVNIGNFIKRSVKPTHRNVGGM
jgi:hypothetical protein